MHTRTAACREALKSADRTALWGRAALRAHGHTRCRPHMSDSFGFPLRLLPRPPVLFGIDCLPLSFLRWLSGLRECVWLFKLKNKSGGNSKLKAGRFDWLSSLVSEQQCIVGKSLAEGASMRISFFLSFFVLLFCFKRRGSFSAEQDSQHLSDGKPTPLRITQAVPQLAKPRAKLSLVPHYLTV